MADVIAIVGASGSGKTLLLSQYAYRNWFLGRRIYANYDLDFGTPRSNLKQRIDDGRLNYTPLFEPQDLFKITDGSAIFISEIDTFGAGENYKGGVDSYDYKSEAATITEKFFKKKLRKLHCSIFYDVQQLRMVPIRIKEETITVFEPYIYKWGRMGEDLVPLIVHYRVRKLNNIEGTHDLTGEIKRLVHPIFGHETPHPKFGFIKYITPDMLSIYDTDSDPFRSRDTFFGNAEAHEPEDPAYRNEKKIMKRFQSRLPYSTVTAIPNSGLNSKKHGDLEIEFPKAFNLPKFIIEVKGVGKVDGGEVKSLNAKTEGGQITNWAGGLAYDLDYGTKHLCAYYDTIRKKIFLFGVQENFQYLGKKAYPYISQLTGVTDLSKFVRRINKLRKKQDEPIDIPESDEVPELNGDLTELFAKAQELKEE